ncbi:MAG: hypothetical protein IJV27_12190 [Prevotella sp.]|nr:hypothetical protein [Prevotella sp.]
MKKVSYLKPNIVLFKVDVDSHILENSGETGTILGKEDVDYGDNTEVERKSIWDN